MTKAALVAAVLALAAPSRAAAPAAAAPAGGMVSLSLVEALAAVDRPELAGLFSFIAERDAPFAFSDLLARDAGALKAYLKKLDKDMDAADGLTDWDHAACASLVNLYSSPLAATFEKPKPKDLSRINKCVLAPVVPLEAIVGRRKK